MAGVVGVAAIDGRGRGAKIAGRFSAVVMVGVGNEVTSELLRLLLRSATTILAVADSNEPMPAQPSPPPYSYDVQASTARANNPGMAHADPCDQATSTATSDKLKRGLGKRIFCRHDHVQHDTGETTDIFQHSKITRLI